MTIWNSDQTFVFDTWPEAEQLTATQYVTVLSSANAACSAYAPPLAAGAVIPDAWKVAEILMARHIWSRTGLGNGDQLGPDGMQVSTYPLVLEARSLLRPKTAPVRRLR